MELEGLLCDGMTQPYRFIQFNGHTQLRHQLGGRQHGVCVCTLTDSDVLI